MKKIGLTGGIGAGKGEVASLLHAMGAAVIDADDEGHLAYRRGSLGWLRIVELFGRQVMDDNEEVDRRLLGRVVFADSEALARLNRVMHPLIRAAVNGRLQQLEKQGQSVVVVQVPLLLEAGWQEMMDEVWVVWAPPEVVVQRLRQQRELTEAEVRQRIEAQTPNEWKIKQAHVAIENAGDLDELRLKVEALWRDRIGPASAYA
jgi:dephospho-CoA kinase